MKRIYHTLTFSLFIACLIFYSCKKESSCESCQIDQLTQPTSNANKSPIALAGFDQIVTLPANYVLLSGSASNDPDGRIAVFQWKKISGPSSFHILKTDSVQTLVTNLAEGVYQFELTVTDSMGLFDKDTTAVTVIQLPNEIIFSEQLWQCWWGCWIEIPDFYNHVPASNFFRVFIKRDNTNTWEEALYGSQVGYGYWVENNGLLVVYGENLGNDTPDIKIVY